MTTHDLELQSGFFKWNDRTRIVITVVDKNIVIGIASIDFLKDNPKEGFFWQLNVRPEYRRLGVANMIIDFAEKNTEARGCSHIALEFIQNETPKWIYDWYYSRGYKPQEEHWNDKVIMWKEFTKGDL